MFKTPKVPNSGRLCKKCGQYIEGDYTTHTRIKHRKELGALEFPDGTEGPVRRNMRDNTWHCPRCHASCGLDLDDLVAHARGCRVQRRGFVSSGRPLPIGRSRTRSSESITLTIDGFSSDDTAEVERALNVSECEDMDVDEDTQMATPSLPHTALPTNPTALVFAPLIDAPTSAEVTAMDVEPAVPPPISPRAPRRPPRIPAIIPKTAPPICASPDPEPVVPRRAPRIACPNPGCTKVYRQQGGLDYHLNTATCKFSPAKKASSSGDANLNALPSPPESPGVAHEPSPSPALTYVTLPPSFDPATHRHPSPPPCQTELPSAPPPEPASASQEIPDALMRFFVTLSQMPSPSVIEWFLHKRNMFTTDEDLDALAEQTAEALWPEMITEICEKSDFSEWLSIRTGLKRRKENRALGAVGNPIVIDD